MQYLTADDVARMNAAFVGEDVPLDFGLLEAAVLRPQTTVGGIDAYPTIHVKAAAMLHSLIRSHPFLDGNKRTGVTALFVFYRLNGYVFAMEQGELVALALDVAEGILGVDAIAKVLAGHTHNVVVANADDDEEQE